MHSALKTKMSLFVVALFFIIICLPAVTFICGIPDSTLIGENRALAQWPMRPNTLAAVREFPKIFENYFNDHFNFRKHFTRWNNIVEVLWLKVSPGLRRPFNSGLPGQNRRPRVQYFNGIVTGKNSWYFWAPNGVIADYRGCNPFSENELEYFKLCLEKRRAWLNDRGIEYLFFIVPEKHTIYPEHLPSNIGQGKAASRLEQLTRYMSDRSDFPVIDLRDIFLRAKQEYRYPIYDPTGTHWNNLGAFIAYQAILEQLAKKKSSLTPLPLSSFSIEAKTTTARPFLFLLGLRDRVYQETVTLHPERERKSVIRHAPSANATARSEVNSYVPGENIIMETGDSRLPRAVVFHDSFMRESLDALLSEHFERVEYYWGVEFNQDIIQRAQPDIVIEEYAERVLLDYLPTDELVQ